MCILVCGFLRQKDRRNEATGLSKEEIKML